LASYPALKRRLNQTASTKRQTLAGGVHSFAANLASVKVSPLYPVDAELTRRMALDTPMELLQIFAEDADIREGDVLSVAGRDYEIRSCANWPESSSRFLHLVLEDIKSG
jgi:hypothetical protein